MLMPSVWLPFSEVTHSSSNYHYIGSMLKTLSSATFAYVPWLPGKFFIFPQEPVVLGTCMMVASRIHVLIVDVYDTSRQLCGTAF